MKVLLVDNYDSYTHNLAHLIAEVTGVWPTIVRNDAIDLDDAPDFVVLSPGPGRPDVPRDVGKAPALLSAYPQVPVLGVCLGMQLLAHKNGGRVSHAAHPRHGRTSRIRHDEGGLFAGVPQDFAAMRYHSLAVTTPPPAWQVTARSDDGEIMGLSHGHLHGVQFHPESVASEHGALLLQNFFGARATHRSPAAPRTTSSPPPDRTVDAVALFAEKYARETHAFLLQWRDETLLGKGEPTNTLGPNTVCLLGYEGERRLIRPTELLRVRHEGPSLAPDTAKNTGAFRHSREQYLQLIARCQQLIKDGEAYELCLTNRFTVDAPVDPFVLYQRLRALNQSPYAAYIKSGDLTLVASSPETFVRVRGNIAETRPIKGTRRRGATPTEDAVLAHALRTSEKDRAENLMIVDVSRHDLGGVASEVRTPRLLEVEKHPHVFQLVSTVEATLRASTTDAIEALFPPASMTGAPKARAIEHLRALEGGPRGMYSGAFGFIDDAGDADLAVTIRSVICEDGRAYFGTGGAILLDSDPEDEWRELLTKAAPLLKALGISSITDG